MSWRHTTWWMRLSHPLSSTSFLSALSPTSGAPNVMQATSALGSLPAPLLVVMLCALLLLHCSAKLFAVREHDLTQPRRKHRAEGLLCMHCLQVITPLWV